MSASTIKVVCTPRDHLLHHLSSFLAKVPSNTWLRFTMAVVHAGTMKVGTSLHRKKAQVVMTLLERLFFLAL